MRDEEVHGVLRSLHHRLALLEARAPTGGRSAVYSGGSRFQYVRDRETASRSFARPSDEEMLKYFLDQFERFLPNADYGGHTAAQLIPLFWQSEYYRDHKNRVLTRVFSNVSFQDAITSVWYSNASNPLQETPGNVLMNILRLIWIFTIQPPTH